MDIIDSTNLIEYSRELTLLYVENDETIVNTNLNLLNLFFDNIIIAKNEEEALKQFKNNQIDILISEVNLARSNGVDLIRKIRKIDNNIAIIYTTARTETEHSTTRASGRCLLTLFIRL